MKMRGSAPTARTVAVLAMLVSPLAAEAAGFALKEQGALDQGTSYAGATARAADPTTLFYNPAGITELNGYQISTNAGYIAPVASVYNESASRSALVGGSAVTGTTGGNAIESALLPSIFATAAITPDLHIGLAIDSPFGLTSQYATTSLARYYALTTSLRVYDIAPTIAYRILPKLSVSATLIVEAANADESTGIDFGSIGAVSGLARYGLLPGSADGIGSVRVSDTAVGYQFGALYEPLPGTRIGLTYRSAIDHRLTGTLSYSGVPSLLAGAYTTQSAYSKLVTPADASLGFSQDLGRWTLLSDVQWTQWSSFQNLTAVFANGTSSTAPEHWHDSWFVALGADYRLTDSVTLRGGAAYDESPASSTYLTPRLSDSSRIWLSGGATWKITPTLAISGAYSHLFGNDVTVALQDAGPGTPNFLRGNLNVSYHTSVDVVSLEATIKF